MKKILKNQVKKLRLLTKCLLRVNTNNKEPTSWPTINTSNFYLLRVDRVITHTKKPTTWPKIITSKKKPSSNALVKIIFDLHGRKVNTSHF